MKFIVDEEIIFAAVDNVLDNHYYLHNGSCECGVWIGPDPDSYRRHMKEQTVLALQEKPFVREQP